jgi:hypothetical protein
MSAPVVTVVYQDQRGTAVHEPSVISSSNHPHIDLDRLTAAKALRLLLLKSPKKFRLQLEREVSNLVKKERSPIRSLESPDGLIRSTGESSLFVTKELALQQSTGNGRAVERYKAVRAPRAHLVNLGLESCFLYTRRIVSGSCWQYARSVRCAFRAWGRTNMVVRDLGPHYDQLSFVFRHGSLDLDDTR